MRYKLGDIVEIRQKDYRGEKGRIVGFETNQLGCPLIVVDLPETKDLVFYPAELKQIGDVTCDI